MKPTRIKNRCMEANWKCR